MPTFRTVRTVVVIVASWFYSHYQITGGTHRDSVGQAMCRKTGVPMDDQRFDQLTRLFACGLNRRQVIAAVVASLAPAILSETSQAAAAKPVGAKCSHHRQCASGLCEEISGTCVAQCASVGDQCGTSCYCQPIGGGAAGHACLAFPTDLVCSGYTPCTFDDRTKDPLGSPSCPHQPGAICSVTGLCSGPEEVCLQLCPPADRWM